MSYSNQLKFFIAGFLIIAVLCKVGCFYLDKKYDTIRRPWAYSDDTSKPLLIGKWKGKVTDPDNIVHEVEMEIFPPTTDEKRWKRVSSKRVKRDRSSRTFFDGMAVLAVNGKKDSCELWGGLDRPDGHQIHFQFRPVKDVHPPGFNLNLVEGVWQGDTIVLDVTFAFFRPDGSSHSDSADPRYDQKGKLTVERIK